jgi:ubiquinone/menaquinone biosynthesis C-methylase UbiE
MTTDFARVKEVFEQWAMYDAVVQANYMHHAELAAALAAWAAAQREPLRIVDLGCGDCWLATHAWRNANVQSYRGADISDSAIERAREHVAFWQGRAVLHAGNLADYLHGLPAASANTVLASYSLHHFSSEAKIATLAEIARVLAPGGTFFWIDAVRKDNESRDAYIERLTHVMSSDWPVLTTEQAAKACAHVRESDFPETDAWMREHVAAAGFEPPTAFLRAEFFSGYAFNKPN